VQREQKGQQAHKRSKLLAEMQPEPPLLPLLESTGRRPLSRAATTSAATGAWYNASSFPRRWTCEGFPIALAELTETTSKASTLHYRMDGFLLNPVSAALVPRVPRVRDTC
jgi:hypothetical protein